MCRLLHLILCRPQSFRCRLHTFSLLLDGLEPLRIHDCCLDVPPTALTCELADLLTPLFTLDELFPPEAQRRPVLVDGHGPHRIESQLLQRRPSGVAIEVAGVLLRCA